MERKPYALIHNRPGEYVTRDRQYAARRESYCHGPLSWIVYGHVDYDGWGRGTMLDRFRTLRDARAFVARQYETYRVLDVDQFHPGGNLEGVYTIADFENGNPFGASYYGAFSIRTVRGWDSPRWARTWYRVQPDGSLILDKYHWDTSG